MNYSEIEMEGMKEILREKEEYIKKLEKENRKLNKTIEYRKKKADKNQEKADFIDKIMKLPGVMVNGKINRTKVAFYYGIGTDFYF